MKDQGQIYLARPPAVKLKQAVMILRAFFPDAKAPGNKDLARDA